MNSSKQSHDLIKSQRLRDEFVAGDNNAYSAIYKLYAKDLYSFGLSLKVKAEIIEDAIHDIFVEIYTHKHNLEKIDNLRYYFMAAFRNRLFYLLKKESNVFEIDEKNNYGLEESDSQEMWIAHEEDTAKEQLIKRLYSGLNKNQQEAIYHRYVEGLSCEEISNLMHINYQSVKNLIHRAIKKMKSIDAIASFVYLLLFVR